VLSRVVWLPQAHRWALLGNAVSVQVAAWIGKALMHPHRHKYQGARDRRFIGMSIAPDAEDGELMHGLPGLSVWWRVYTDMSHHLQRCVDCLRLTYKSALRFNEGGGAVELRRKVVKL